MTEPLIGQVLWLNHAGCSDVVRSSATSAGCKQPGRFRLNKPFSSAPSALKSPRRDDAVMTRTVSRGRAASGLTRREAAPSPVRRTPPSSLDRTTTAVFTPAVALTPDEGDALRPLAIIAAAITVAALAPLARALSRATAVASAYSRESSGPRNGCDGSPLHDPDITVATFLVPCGARIRICLGRRCVVAVRKDSGPYAAGRQLDLNLGVVRALGFPTCAAFGVRTVTWSRA